MFFGGMDAVAGPLLRQLAQAGNRMRFMAGDGICSNELPKLAAGGMNDGQVLCAEAGGVESDLAAGMQRFKSRFKSSFDVDVQIYAPYTYDAVSVMVDAMVRAGSADPARYLSYLASTNAYRGLTGAISFDAKGDIINGAMTLYTYRGNRREQVAVVR